ncbi:MAG TPA: hypothetical protein VKH15_01735 [Candidatus Acidoferrum sp.]|nr:hypothetical protein [Candidatus Acidoferrum sp.]
MAGQYIRNSKLIAGVAIADLVLALFIYRFDGAAVLVYSLFANAASVAWALLRLFILVAHWVAVSAYLYGGSGLLAHTPQVGPSLLTLLRVVAG